MGGERASRGQEITEKLKRVNVFGGINPEMFEAEIREKVTNLEVQNSGN